jgi:predicted small lipoprotein YifL
MPLILQNCGRKGDLYLPRENIPVKQNQVEASN